MDHHYLNPTLAGDLTSDALATWVIHPNIM
jgi:hypothetical protein